MRKYKVTLSFFLSICWIQASDTLCIDRSIFKLSQKGSIEFFHNYLVDDIIGFIIHNTILPYSRKIWQFGGSANQPQNYNLQISSHSDIIILRTCTKATVQQIHGCGLHTNLVWMIVINTYKMKRA